MSQTNRLLVILLAAAEPPAEWFVLDSEAITDIDTTGADGLALETAGGEQRTAFQDGDAAAN